MTEVKAVDRARVRDIAQVFAALSWPAPREEMTDIGERLGWTIGSQTLHSTRFDTGFPTNPSRGGVTVDDGNIGQVTINLTDRVKEPDASQAKTLSGAAAEFRDELSSLLGKPVRSRGGAQARYTWDLPNQGRLALTDSGGAVRMIVLQKRYADIERREERLGIPDDRDPDADLA